MQRIRKSLVLVILIFILWTKLFSESSVIRQLEPIEKKYGTDSSNAITFHAAVYYPYEIAMNFDGFIVGIEKSPIEKVTKSKRDIITIDRNISGISAKKAYKMLTDRKIMFISHILENYGRPYGMGNCADYNIYAAIEKGKIESTVKFCNPKEVKKRKNIYFPDPQDVYVNSWNALSILKSRVKARLDSAKQKYTHIILIVMGWNTDQEKAIRNFNSIITQLNAAAKEQGRMFHPLVIGVTWPSQWPGPERLISFTNKKHDADEIAISWLGALLHFSLIPLKNPEKYPNLPLVVIGHSFGARATSLAVCVGPSISKSDRLIIPGNTDILISLQGAYSINRFFIDKGMEGIKYPGKCRLAEKIFLTSSVNDHALSKSLFAPMVGEGNTYKYNCSNKRRDFKRENFECIKAEANGTIPKSTGHITYVNADNLIIYNAYRSGGKAHSDIYRFETGRMLWKMIETASSKNN